MIHVVSGSPGEQADTDRYTNAQYEACDMLVGNLHPELGGSPNTLDILGVNYYWNNQWVHNHDRVPLGHHQHRPLHRMLVELHQRFHRPILITETGAEFEAAVGWLGYIASEVRQAQREGAEIVGVCLYPVMDYLGWDDERHCRCGLIEVARDWRARSLRPNLVAELRVQQSVLTSQTASEASAAFVVTGV